MHRFFSRGGEFHGGVIAPAKFTSEAGGAGGQIRKFLNLTFNFCKF